MMHNRAWMLGVLIGGFLVGSTGLLLGAAKSGKTSASSTVRSGDINAVNSQIVVGGESVVQTDSGLVVGNGRRVTKAVPVAEQFHGIDLSGVFKTEVVCGSPALVEVLIDENLQPLITATVKNGILSVRFTKPVQTKENPHLKIVLPSLDILQMSGSDEVRAVGVKGKSLRLIHEGSGEVKLVGQVEDFSCTASGVGEVDASKLTCRSADVSISGVGGVTCRPEAKLKASLSGIGNVYCLTKPAAVEKDVTGLGDVEFVGK